MILKGMGHHLLFEKKHIFFQTKDTGFSKRTEKRRPFPFKGLKKENLVKQKQLDERKRPSLLWKKNRVYCFTK